jgi:hypothetical protein
MFNPEPQVQQVPIGALGSCFVIDDALREPQRWVDLAVAHAGDFEALPGNAYPGPELRLPDAITAALDAFFARHLRARLGARRTVRAYTRLALATLPPERLQPRQWLCHRDRLAPASDHCAIASVLYLFRDPDLGGTRFFRPRRDEAQTARLVHDSGVLDPARFSARYGVTPGYLTGDNDWFETVAVVPPRFNRLIVYDGDLFHGSDIGMPAKLSADPARGRLTFNGFLTCQRSA